MRLPNPSFSGEPRPFPSPLPLVLESNMCGGHSNVPNGVACTAYKNCPANATVWTRPTTVGSQITALSFNEIVVAINDEKTRRGTGTTVVAVTASNVTTAAEWQSLGNDINTWLAVGWNCGAAGASSILAAWTDTAGLAGLKKYTNQAEIVCLCNCNYSCTCNCNYCTCNCNNCACNCDRGA